MLSNIGMPGLILIFVIALIIFGPKKLPELGKAVGMTLKEFKSSVNGAIEEKEAEKNESQDAQQSEKKNM